MLCSIAKKALTAPLPDGWEQGESEDGTPYHYNPETGESIWEHPLDEHYRQEFKSAKMRHSAILLQSVCRMRRRVKEREKIQQQQRKEKQQREHQRQQEEQRQREEQQREKKLRAMSMSMELDAQTGQLKPASDASAKRVRPQSSKKTKVIPVPLPTVTPAPSKKQRQEPFSQPPARLSRRSPRPAVAAWAATPTFF